eukprot:TRINITY_DN9819_c0_g1_i4.p1 TRINITY_DN9819_c0_g1~~TRINITY_DN9819_c0_g1_i4.p1  ORF type:complete len:243 (+),score=-24.07 TRINITY_DN9819_c0_g1_i4:748-1476(+)
MFLAIRKYHIHDSIFLKQSIIFYLLTYWRRSIFVAITMYCYRYIAQELNIKALHIQILYKYNMGLIRIENNVKIRVPENTLEIFYYTCVRNTNFLNTRKYKDYIILPYTIITQSTTISIEINTVLYKSKYSILCLVQLPYQGQKIHMQNNCTNKASQKIKQNNQLYYNQKKNKTAILKQMLQNTCISEIYINAINGIKIKERINQLSQNKCYKIHALLKYIQTSACIAKLYIHDHQYKLYIL